MVTGIHQLSPASEHNCHKNRVEKSFKLKQEALIKEIGTLQNFEIFST